MLGIGNGSSRFGIGNVGVQSKFAAWNRKWRSSSQVRSLKSEMEEFESNSDAWNREWRCSTLVRGLESEM